MNLNSQNQFYLLFFTLLGHIASVNNVVVTVLHLLKALHRRIVVYRIIVRNSKIDDAHKQVSLSWNFKLNDIAGPNYVN